MTRATNTRPVAELPRTRWGAVLAVSLAIVLAALDLTIVAVALPLIDTDLAAPPAVTQWVLLAGRVLQGAFGSLISILGFPIVAAAVRPEHRGRARRQSPARSAAALEPAAQPPTPRSSDRGEPEKDRRDAMSTSTPAPTQVLTARRRRNARMLAVAAAVVAALAVWLVAELLLGTDLRSPAYAAQESQDVGAVNVIISAAVASLAGWGLLAVLERFTARARTVWTVIAALAMLVSLGAPLSGTGITGANRAWLALMHVAVGAVFISLLARTSRSRS